jgi:competence protein CoiA
MPFYACDENDEILHACEATKTGTYHCIECFLPVKLRRHRHLSYHFYHLKASPSCRLYSKTEDHMLAQLQIQKLFPPGAIQLERLFSSISRVADVCWEEKKLIFEIQCSLLEIPEAEARIRDYASEGYQVIWLLDDRIFNRRKGLAVEIFLRKTPAYYLHVRRGLTSLYYDQFEVFGKEQRRKKGKKLPIDLLSPRKLPSRDWQLSGVRFPRQVLDRAQRELYFQGDRLYKALQAFRFASAALSMEYWHNLEKIFAKRPKRANRIKIFFRYYLLDPYERFLIKLGSK